mmetsp:Transcript_44780/g.51738  ORF Transcript_44780/g.51738 Transcript_44780/m.51738 type:complete len:226 (+) Transcript_44780:117-794(+)
MLETGTLTCHNASTEFFLILLIMDSDVLWINLALSFEILLNFIVENSMDGDICLFNYVSLFDFLLLFFLSTFLALIIRFLLLGFLLSTFVTFTTFFSFFIFAGFLIFLIIFILFLATLVSGNLSFFFRFLFRVLFRVILSFFFASLSCFLLDFLFFLFLLWLLLSTDSLFSHMSRYTNTELSLPFADKLWDIEQERLKSINSCDTLIVNFFHKDIYSLEWSSLSL